MMELESSPIQLQSAAIELESALIELESSLIVPHALAKAGDIKTHSSVFLSVSPSVIKTLTWVISSEVLMIKH